MSAGCPLWYDGPTDRDGFWMQAWATLPNPARGHRAKGGRGGEPLRLHGGPHCVACVSVSGVESGRVESVRYRVMRVCARVVCVGVRRGMRACVWWVQWRSWWVEVECASASSSWSSGILGGTYPGNMDLVVRTLGGFTTLSASHPRSRFPLTNTPPPTSQ